MAELEALGDYAFLGKLAGRAGFDEGQLTRLLEAVRALPQQKYDLFIAHALVAMEVNATEALATLVWGIICKPVREGLLEPELATRFSDCWPEDCNGMING